MLPRSAPRSIAFGFAAALAVLGPWTLGCVSEGERAAIDDEVEAVRGRDPGAGPGQAKAAIPTAWAVGEGEACAWAWKAPVDVTTHMRAATEGIKAFADVPPGKRRAHWDRLLDVAIEHALVAMAAMRDDPSAALSPDGETNALDAAWKATSMIDDAVRAATPEGKAPAWPRWPELVYLREVLRSMSGDYVVEPLARNPEERPFVVEEARWRTRIESCRAHRLELGARERRAK